MRRQSEYKDADAAARASASGPLESPIQQKYAVNTWSLKFIANEVQNWLWTDIQKLVLSEDRERWRTKKKKRKSIAFWPILFLFYSWSVRQLREALAWINWMMAMKSFIRQVCSLNEWRENCWITRSHPAGICPVTSSLRHGFSNGSRHGQKFLDSEQNQTKRMALITIIEDLWANCNRGTPNLCSTPRIYSLRHQCSSDRIAAMLKLVWILRNPTPLRKHCASNVLLIHGSYPKWVKVSENENDGLRDTRN